MAFGNLDIDTKKIKSNILKIKDGIPNATRVLLVAKANAYGLGAIPICKDLNKVIDYIGVATMTEALELREASIKTPILLLSEPNENEWNNAIKNDITVTVYDDATIHALDTYAKKQKTSIKTHLKIDTGMTRLGSYWETAKTTIQTWLETSEYVVKEGLYSHFANSESDHALNEIQLTRFLKETNEHANTMKHLANSDGVNNIKNSHFDLVRIGLSAYENSFTLTAPIRQIQTVKKGTAVGYGSTYTTTKDCKIAIIGIGYADGISTQYSNKGAVSINGENYPIVGRVCMDMTMVEIPLSAKISEADDAIILAPNKTNTPNLMTMATLTNQNPREIMTRFSKRISRTYR